MEEGCAKKEPQADPSQKFFEVLILVADKCFQTKQNPQEEIGQI